MGCDGGTIPKRDELVRLKKKPEQKDKDSELVFKWRCCSITQQHLEQPAVACGLGRLYNKMSVIEGLLTKSLPENASHIKSLKDVKDLNLTNNPAYKPDAEKVEGNIDHRAAPFICPLIGLEMSGKFRFCFIWNCGCVFSERALKEIKSNICSKCQVPFTNDDVVVINAAGEELDTMRSRMAIRLQKMKEAKKLKKKNNAASSAVKVEPSTSSESVSDSKNIEINKSNTLISDGVDKEIKVEPSTSSEPVPNSKIVKVSKPIASTSNGVGKKRIADLKSIHDPAFKKAKGSYSIAKDPEASEVFKSLFTSHETEKQQDRAHWITYNPFYN